MNSVIVTLWLLSQLAPSDANTTPDDVLISGDVVVELKNGNRIEGRFLEKDGRFVVLVVKGGEMRINLRQVREIHPSSSEPPTDELPTELITPAPRQPAESQLTRTTLTLPPTKSGAKRQLRFSIPLRWKPQDDEASLLHFVDAKHELRFQVREVDDTQSLWAAVNRMRRLYEEQFQGFRLRSERFGNRWRHVRTWEIEFVYGEGQALYRERHVILDFARVKRVLEFRAPAAEFDSHAAAFELIVAGVQYDEEAPPAAQK